MALETSRLGPCFCEYVRQCALNRRSRSVRCVWLGPIRGRATPSTDESNKKITNETPTPCLDPRALIMLCTATSITSNIDYAWLDDENGSTYFDQIAMNTGVNNNNNKSEDSICRLCNHGASDIRVLGCGCTLHSVSSRVAVSHCFDGMTKKYPVLFFN